jgi:proline iminopeptidase
VLADINGIKMFFDIEGAGSRPEGSEMVEKPVCFVLHGGPALDHSYFKPWLTPLTDDFQFVYIDHRGTGGSPDCDPDSYVMDNISDDLEALRNHLGLGKIDVMGNSYGGFITLSYALKYPDSINRLILVGTSPSHRFADKAGANLEATGTDGQKEYLARALEGSVTSPEDYSKMWQTIAPLYFHDYPDADREAMVARIKGNGATSAQMFKIDMPNYDVEDQLGSITQPTLITVGRHDWVTPVSESEILDNGIPNSELVIFENAGHFPFIEENEAFVDAVRSFNQSHPVSGGVRDAVA